MKYSIIFKCESKHYDYIIKKIFQANITIINSKKKNDEYIFITYEEDFNNLKKIDYKNAAIYVGYNGLYNIISIIKHNFLYVLITFIIIMILFLSNYLVIKVNIHTNDVNLNRIVKYYLMDHNIKDFSIKKDFKTIRKIKENILEKFNNEIEWIEITPNGYSYDVNIIKRKQNKNSITSDKCNYIAKKSGTITKIKVSKGVLMVQENNYVNQGDILISGSVIYNDELKTEVCASGKIYGEVWYEVEVSYPLIKKYTLKNKNKFYNIRINFLGKKYQIFKNKYNAVKTIKNIGNDNFGLDILSSSNEIFKTIKISSDEGIKIAVKKAKENIMFKSSNKSKILSQNILKKYTNNDTIYVKVLITAEEELGVVESY